MIRAGVETLGYSKPKKILTHKNEFGNKKN